MDLALGGCLVYSNCGVIMDLELGECLVDLEIGCIFGRLKIE